MKNVLMCICLALGTAGCGGGGGGGSGESTAGAPSGPTSKPLVNYRPVLLSSFVGQYTGACELLPNQPTEAIVTLTAEGLLSLLPGGSDSLTGNQITVGFHRDLVASNPSAAFFAGGAEFGDQYPDFTLRADAGGELSIRVNKKSVLCRQVAGALPLMSKTAYEVARQFLDVETTRLKCVDGLARTDLGIQTYRIKNGVIEVIGDTFSLLDGLKTDAVSAQGSTDANVPLASFYYRVELVDGRQLGLRFDAYGDLEVLSYQTSADHVALCGLVK